LADKEVTRKFLRDVYYFIGKGIYSDAAKLLAGSNFVEFKQDWTVEVENLHSNPLDGEEEILAMKLDIALLEIADNLVKGVERLDQVTYWKIVLCLNKLGRNAPKKLVEKVRRMGHEYHGDLSSEGEIYRIATFLPFV
jgi:hypothetical protein